MWWKGPNGTILEDRWHKDGTGVEVESADRIPLGRANLERKMEEYAERFHVDHVDIKVKVCSQLGQAWDITHIMTSWLEYVDCDWP